MIRLGMWAGATPAGSQRLAEKYFESMQGWGREQGVMLKLSEDRQYITATGAYIQSLIWCPGGGYVYVRNCRIETVTGVMDPFRFLAIVELVMVQSGSLTIEWLQRLAYFCRDAKWSTEDLSILQMSNLEKELQDVGIESQDRTADFDPGAQHSYIG